MVKYAFVTLLMNGDDYLPGCLALGYSFKMTKTKADVCIMVTPDITEEIRKVLLTVYNRCIEVSYLECQGYQIRPKQQSKYPWMSLSPTKWNCLSFVEYEKVCFIDSDEVVLNNIDNIFDKTAPAANVLDIWTKTRRLGGLSNPYGRMTDGQIINPDHIKEGLSKAMVISGGTVLLEPNLKHFEEYKKIIIGEDKYPYCYSGLEEKTLTQLYLSLDIPIYYLDDVYNFIPWLMTPKRKKINTLHYFSDKPWNCVEYFADMDYFYYILEQYCRRYPSYSKYIKTEKGEAKDKKCVLCKRFHSLIQRSTREWMCLSIR